MDEVYIVYADVLFLINLVLDFICLFITARLTNRVFKLYRLIAASALGGAYCTAVFSLSSWYLLPLHLAAAVVLCLVALGRHSIAKTTLLFVVTSAVLGGILSAVYALLGKYSHYNGGFYTEINPVLLIIFALFAAIAALAYLSQGKKRINTVTAEADMVHGKTALCLSLLVDSGCLVRDPMSGRVVIIIAARALSPFICCNNVDDIAVLGRTARVVPIKTAAGSKLLPAFKPDKLFINERAVDAVIAIDNQNDNYHGNDGLAPLEIL